MTVPRIFKFPIEGASLETKVPSALPAANPLGRAETPSRYSKYSSAVANSGSVSGVSCEAANDRVGVRVKVVAEAYEVKAKLCLVEINKSKRAEEGAHMLFRFYLDSVKCVPMLWKPWGRASIGGERVLRYFEKRKEVREAVRPDAWQLFGSAVMEGYISTYCGIWNRIFISFSVR
jgi:hypothetical protein